MGGQDMRKQPLAGRYRLGTEIARGAIGSVWRGEDLSDGSQVAVKLLRPEAAEQSDLVAGFHAEATILSRLDHPNVIRLRARVTAGDRQALVLDLIEGTDLRHRIRRDGPLPAAVALDVAAQVADALAYLHDLGIAHGDVKPANLLVPADGGQVRLIDFGAARTSADSDLPRPTLATPEYVAPEVVGGGRPAGPADVYALGIVLFELLCGRSPYRGGSASDVLARHGHCVPVPPPGLPPMVWSVFERCLAVAADDRPDARSLAARLRGLEAALDGFPALPPLSADAVTWWSRGGVGGAAGAGSGATGSARVSWQPLLAHPVSPAAGAAGAAGRLVTLPAVGSASGVDLASGADPTSGVDSAGLVGLAASPATFGTGPLPVSTVPSVRSGPSPSAAPAAAVSRSGSGDPSSAAASEPARSGSSTAASIAASSLASSAASAETPLRAADGRSGPRVVPRVVPRSGPRQRSMLRAGGVAGAVATLAAVVTGLTLAAGQPLAPPAGGTPGGRPVVGVPPAGSASPADAVADGSRPAGSAPDGSTRSDPVPATSLEPSPGGASDQANHPSGPEDSAGSAGSPVAVLPSTNAESARGPALPAHPDGALAPGIGDPIPRWPVSDVG
ncbi:protein kinase [Solwaraspora sp. WMMD406]|uniref:serine/threonine-protein kinase n=1 Tax=Solwaraspora sp. WMMD406 TaxID=3016095 RepID=UPI002415C8F4|nr:serine/threonine-protein kinase [Solwaraspora sp. WMMD406]MDG4763948.1 protein kinase [Solwaraspora sp. WMMD406]